MNFEIQFIIAAMAAFGVIFCRRLFYKKKKDISIAALANPWIDVIVALDLLILLNPFLMRWFFEYAPFSSSTIAMVYMTMLTVSVVWVIGLVREEWKSIKSQ